MRDITAVVLSIGEPYTDRAIASVQQQTMPVADTIVVRGISPFHRALNAGAAQVRTPFFVQVDADMSFDDTCLDELRGRMCDTLGLVSGHLRDPVIGRVQGVRLYRTECFQRVQIRDSISPDMDFGNDIRRHGWGRLYTLRYDGPRAHWHTFGDHRPDYNPHYTFCKFVLEGVRCRYRRHEGRVRMTFQQLRESRHEAATIALIAVAHGLFLREQRDLLAPYQRTPDFALLETFLAAPGGDAGDVVVSTTYAADTLRERFKRSYELGIHSRQRGRSSAFIARLHDLKARTDLGSWLELVGQCHGLFHEQYTDVEANEAYASITELLTERPPGWS
jgi:hypothetical protein